MNESKYNRYIIDGFYGFTYPQASIVFLSVFLIHTESKQNASKYKTKKLLMCEVN